MTTIEELLKAHTYIPSGLRGVSKCACGVPFHGMPHDHRAHVAEQVTAWMTERLAASEMRKVVWDEIFWASWRQHQGDYADEILENHRRLGLDPRHCNDGICLTAQAIAEGLVDAALAAVTAHLCGEAP